VFCDQDERNQCDKLFKERDGKGQAKCSGKVTANGKEYPVTEACARSCSKEAAIKKIKTKHDAVMKEDQEKLAAKQKVQEQQNEESMALYDKLNFAKRKIRSLKKSTTTEPNSEGPSPSIQDQIKSQEKELPVHKAAIDAIEKQMAEHDKAMFLVEDKLSDLLILAKREEMVEVRAAVYGKKDHFELDFPLAAFEKDGVAREQANLPIRDDGVGRLMRFNRVLAGERYPHLLFIDEATRVLFQIDASTGRVSQLVDFWKVRLFFFSHRNQH